MIMSEIPLIADFEIEAIEERRHYADKEMKRLYDSHLFDPDMRELFALLGRVIADNRTLVQAAKGMKRYINVNIH